MKKVTNLCLTILCIGILLFSCNSNRDTSEILEADVTINTNEKLSGLPSFISNGFSSSSGRTLEDEIEEVSRLNFSTDQGEASQIAITLKPLTENETTTIMYDEGSQAPYMILHEVLLENGNKQLNYFTLDGELFMQLEGENDTFSYTYKLDGYNSSGRTMNCFTREWQNCTDRVEETTAFYILVTAAYLTGGSALGGVAAGLVVGCSIVAVDVCNSVSSSTTTSVYQMATSIQRSPSNLLRGTGKSTGPLPMQLVKLIG